MTAACPPERSMCNADGKCVTCMNDAQCPDPAHPRCDLQTNSCVGCDGASDCSVRFPNAPHCDRDTKACVACSPTGEAQCAVGLFCDPNLYLCVPGTPRRSNCEPCGADEECAQSPSISACIEVAADNGRYCFAAAVSATPRCEAGYMPLTAPGRPDVMYCMPPSSCRALADARSGKTCNSAMDCGRRGLCPAPGGACTVQCNSTQDCPSPLSCDPILGECRKN
jgi:hypothetical protein